MKLPDLLSDLDEVLRPELGTSSLHDQGPGQPQARDRAELAEGTAHHPPIGADPAVGSISGPAAEASLDASIAAAREGCGDCVQCRTPGARYSDGDRSCPQIGVRHRGDLAPMIGRAIQRLGAWLFRHGWPRLGLAILDWHERVARWIETS